MSGYKFSACCTDLSIFYDNEGHLVYSNVSQNSVEKITFCQINLKCMHDIFRMRFIQKIRPGLAKFVTIPARTKKNNPEMFGSCEFVIS